MAHNYCPSCGYCLKEPLPKQPLPDPLYPQTPKEKENWGDMMRRLKEIEEQWERAHPRYFLSRYG